MKTDCLYKYLDIRGALSMIMNKELQFTNPIYFNDPFDSHPGLFDYSVPEGYEKGWAPEDFWKKKAICDSSNERRRAWICSLSKRHDSMLMWSYYTNHRGVCIGLDRESHSHVLSKKCLGQTFMDNVEVKYRDVLEKPNGICDMSYMYQLCTKSAQWQHEQEVRHIIIEPNPWVPYHMIRPTTKKELIPWTEVRFYPKLSSECFTSIYLGAQISDSDKLRVLKAVRVSMPHVKVFQMVPDCEYFSFKEIPVDVEKFVSEHKESAWNGLKSKVRGWLPFRIRIGFEWTRKRTVRRNFRM